MRRPATARRGIGRGSGPHSLVLRVHSPLPSPGTAPFGPHRTAAEEAAWLRSKLPEIDRKVTDPAEREQYKAELERLAAEIEAGRRRLGDAH